MEFVGQELPYLTTIEDEEKDFTCKVFDAVPEPQVDCFLDGNRLEGGFGNYQTGLTEFRHQMRSGDLLAYLSLDCLSDGIISCS